MAKIMPMRSLELDDEDQFDMPTVTGISEKPRFPYGLRISLENAQLAAIGLSPVDCCVGGMIHLHGLARITSVSMNETEGGDRSRVELQFEQMCCAESEDEENSAAEDKMDRGARRAKLYGRSGK